MSIFDILLDDDPGMGLNFQEPSGTTANDASPNNEDGTVTTGVTVNATGPNDRIPKAYDFSGGTSNGVETTFDPYTGNTVVTFEFPFKIDAGYTIDRALFGCSGGWNAGPVLYVSTTDGELELWANGSVRKRWAAGTLPTNTWVWISFEMNQPAGTCVLKVDDVTIEPTADNSFPFPLTPQNLVIGTSGPAETEGVPGMYGLFYAYTAPLSGARKTAHYRGQNAPTRKVFNGSALVDATIQAESGSGVAEIEDIFHKEEPYLAGGDFEGGTLAGFNLGGTVQAPTVASDIVQSGSTYASKHRLEVGEPRAELILGGTGGPIGSGGFSQTYWVYHGDELVLEYDLYIVEMIYGVPGGHNLANQFPDGLTSPRMGLHLFDDGADPPGFYTHGGAMGGDHYLRPSEHGEWHHIRWEVQIAATDSSGYYRLYIDGVLEDSATNVQTVANNGQEWYYVKLGLYRNPDTVVGTSEVRVDNAFLRGKAVWA